MEQLIISEDVTLEYKAKEGIFSKIGVEFETDEVMPGINLDFAYLHKRCTVSDIMNYLLGKYPEVSNNIFSRWIKFIALLAIHRNTIHIKFSDENNFDELRKLLKVQSGVQYIEESDAVSDTKLLEIVELLVLEGFMVKHESKYFIKGYFLDSLKIPCFDI